MDSHCGGDVIAGVGIVIPVQAGIQTAHTEHECRDTRDAGRAVIGRRALLVGAGLGVGAFAAGFAASAWRRGETPAPAGGVIRSSSAEPAGEAPDFAFTDQHGVERRFSDWNGTVRVVNFWATWCPPCVHEIPMLVAAQESYRARGVQIVGVAVDDPDAAFAMAEELGMNYPTMADSRRTIDLLHAYGNRAAALPFTAFVDPQGTIRDRHVGELTLEQTRKGIEALLP